MKIRLTSDKDLHSKQNFEAETVFIKDGIRIRWFGEAGFGEITVCMDKELANYEIEVDGSDLWIGYRDGKVD